MSLGPELSYLRSPPAAFIQAPSIWPYLKYAHEALGRRLFRNASQGNVNQLTNDPASHFIPHSDSHPKWQQTVVGGFRKKYSEGKRKNLGRQKRVSRKLHLLCNFRANITPG